jgi:archaellum component FlaC
MSKDVKNDIEDLDIQIKQIEKEYSLLINKVSRSPYNMTTETFMRISDDNRKSLINDEIKLYCERDNKVRALRNQQKEIRLANKDYYREVVYSV